MKYFLFILVIFFNHHQIVKSNRQITHEDIRDAILSMVHLFRDNTDKLERHELRERQLGDQLKKALSSLDKRGRAQDHTLNGIVAKLNIIDDRLKKIEFSMQHQDDSTKGSYSIDTIPLEQSLTSKTKLEAMEAAYNSRMDYIVSLIEKLQSELLTTSTKMTQLFDQQREYHSIEHKKWHGSIISQIDKMTLNNGGYMTNDNNSLINEIRTIKDELIGIVNTILTRIHNKLTDIDYSKQNENENLIDNISKNREMMEDYFRQVNEKFDTLSTDIDALEKIEKILIQTDENILDTKRKTEFMMFQIIKGVEESISSQGHDINDTINGRFNILTDLIVDNQNISLINISGKIETEMGQVWRQIGILYNQLTNSANKLDELKSETQTFANQTNEKIVKIDDKVEAINTHVIEIHENINYFMGRLSLITQEFNQTRAILAHVVENLKIDLDKPREENKDLGPGPIPIDSNLDNRL